MKASILTAVVIATLAAGLGFVHAAEPAATDIRLSPGLLALLRGEMREVSAGAQGIALSLATADWKAIQATSARIRASYIMEKRLTPAQTAELERALPEAFKRLDAEFHQRAEKIGAAAAAHNAEHVALHYSRMLETCAACHAQFARSRFPGFAPVARPVHAH